MKKRIKRIIVIVSIIAVVFLTGYMIFTGKKIK